MRFEDVAHLLPGVADGTVALDAETAAFIETDLRSQAELARYDQTLRALGNLRKRYLEPAPGLLSQTLAGLEAAGERNALHSMLRGRKLAYAGAISGVVAAGAAAALVIARSRRRAALAA